MIGIFFKKEGSRLNIKRESDILEIKKLIKNRPVTYTTGKSCSYYNLN
jgi:predicted Ser/Thr protein kinase